MLAPWVATTLCAAFTQNVRNVLQKRIKERLSIAGATFSRFAFAAPLAAVYLFTLAIVHKEPIPAPTSTFIVYASVGGIAQILANVFLLLAFRHQNFVVATTFTKTEAAQTALLSALLLHEPPGSTALLGIAISFLGVLMLAAGRHAVSLKTLITAWLDKPALLGLCSGLGLAVAAIGYRGATLALPEGSAGLRAAATLSFVTLLQLAVLGAYLAWRERQTIADVLSSVRGAISVGMASAVTSALWFTAIAMENAAHVRALGQIELVFAFLSSWLIFKERTRPWEFAGIATMIGGLVLVILGA